MPARITELRNAEKDFIDSFWLERWSPDDEVVSSYCFDIDAKTHAGRKVYIVPNNEADAPITRGDDQHDFGLMFFVVERFAKDDGQGQPDDEWVDERVDFTEQLYRRIVNPRRARILADEGKESDTGLWPEVSELTLVYDHDELKERRLFLSVFNVTYREQLTNGG